MRTLTTALLGLALLGISLAESRFRPVWFDEIFTDTIARAGGPREIWAALARGTDLNPPLNYLAVHGASAALGPSPLALRLPSALGYLLMSLCLYRVAARRYPAPYARLAMLFPVITQAFAYSYEGRPYGLEMGAAALALACWQDAADRVRRPLALAGLAGALAAAVSAHYYGVLVVVPLAVGELVRSRASGRVDVAVWIAFAVGMAALLAFVPLMAAGRAYAATFWAKPTLRGIPEFYIFLFQNSAPGLVALLVIAAFAGRSRPEEATAEGYALHELVALTTFAALPVFAVALAYAGRLGYTERYSLATTVGVGGLVAAAAYRPLNRRAALVCGAALLGYGAVLHSGALKAAATRSAAPAREAPLTLGRAGAEDLPIAIPNAHLYLESADAPRDGGAVRPVFISPGEDTSTRGLRALSRLRPLVVEDYASFLAAHDRFLVYDVKHEGLGRWMVTRLLDDGARVAIRAEAEDLIVYEVERPGR